MNDNITIWDELYQSGQNYLHYPDDAFLKLFFNSMQKPATHKVLDFGAGSGAISEFLSEHCQTVYSYEPSKSARATMQQRLGARVEILDEKALSTLVTGSLDLIVAWQVLYYLNNEQLTKTLDLFKRLLKPGGVLIASLVGEKDLYATTSRCIGPDLYRLESVGQTGAEIQILPINTYRNYLSGFEVDIGETIFSIKQRCNHYYLLVAKKVGESDSKKS